MPQSCSASLHQTFLLNSASNYRSLFTDRVVKSPVGKVTAIPGDTGLTAFISCVDYGGTLGTAYIIRGFEDPYQPASGPNVCREAMHALLFRLGSTRQKYIPDFPNDVYVMAFGDSAAVYGLNGKVAVLRCSPTEGFTIPTVGEL